MEIVDNTALQLTVPDSVADEILSSNIRCGKTTDGNVLVYWDYPEASVLAHIFDKDQPNENIPDVPSPMLRDYKWPGMFDPFAHQKTTDWCSVF
jgi:hypothetical protein